MIILASTSSARKSMLTHAGLRFSTASPMVDEAKLVDEHPNWNPQETAHQLAIAKALDVSSRHRNDLVIGADQVLALGDKSFSKPKSIDECRNQVLELRGKPHHLISAVVCARGGHSEWAEICVASLTMRHFSMSFLDDYLAAVGSDCTTSVGGYKIEGPGIQLFDSVEGDHFTILGMPLLPLLKYLRTTGELQS